MKVLLLTSDAYGANGGIALYNRDIVEGLAAIEEVNEIVVVARNMPWDAVEVPAKVSVLTGSVGGKIRFVGAALQAARETYGLIICGHVNLLPLAVALNQIARAPLVLMVYGIDVWQPPYKLVRHWLKAVDAVWSISMVTTQRMNSWAGLPGNRFRQLPNAIHLDRYGVAPRSAELQALHGLAGACVIMTLARLPEKERYKGVDEVIESLPALLTRFPNMKYLVCGDGNDRLRLTQKTQTFGVAASVVFTGMVSEADKADYFRLADAFVMPGRGEGFGFVFLEALACGVPVVGSKLDGSREALRNGELGELADPNDLASVQACIARALAKPRDIPEGLAYFDWPSFKNRLAVAVQQLIHPDIADK